MLAGIISKVFAWNKQILLPHIGPGFIILLVMYQWNSFTSKRSFPLFNGLSSLDCLQFKAILSTRRQLELPF